MINMMTDAEKKKYTFDLDFIEERVRQQEVDRQRKEQQRLEAIKKAEEEAKHRFTSEQIDEIKKAAYQEGYETGQNDTKKSLDQAIHDQAAKILAQMARFNQEDAARYQSMHRIALKAVAAVLERIIPTAFEKVKDQEILGFIKETIQTVKSDVSDLSVMVSQADLEQVVPELQKKLSGDDQKKLIFVADASLEKGECRIEWQVGGVERSLADMQKNALAMIEKLSGIVLSLPADLSQEDHGVLVNDVPDDVVNESADKPMQGAEEQPVENDDPNDGGTDG